MDFALFSGLSVCLGQVTDWEEKTMSNERSSEHLREPVFWLLIVAIATGFFLLMAGKITGFF